MRCAIALAAAAGSCSLAAGQSNARFELMFVSSTVSPSSPSAQFELHAAWDEAMPGDFVFSGADYDLAASSGVFTDAKLVMGRSPINNPGVINGNRVDGAAIGQVHIPSLGIFGDTSNPVLLAEYVWTTSDFTPRTVEFVTENTTRFIVTGRTPVTPNLVRGLTPGFGRITVVPGPGVVGPLAFGGALCAWRRRR